MGSTLRDELLKAGLVDDAKVRKAKKVKYKREKQRRRNDPAGVDPAKLAAQRAIAEKAERDRELNRQRQEKAERNANAAQVRQLIETNRLPKEDGEVDFNFADDKKIKRLHLAKATHTQLSRGRLGIVRLDGQYHLVPTEIAEKVRRRDPGRVVMVDQDRRHDDDDAMYAEHPIPDDLTW